MTSYSSEMLSDFPNENYKLPHRVRFQIRFDHQAIGRNGKGPTNLFLFLHQVYEAMKEQVFYGIEAYMARKKVEECIFGPFGSPTSSFLVTNYILFYHKLYPFWSQTTWSPNTFWSTTTYLQVLEGGDIGQLEILAKDPDYFNPDPFQV